MSCILRGYQQGVVATVPAITLASVLTTIVGWPLPLEGEAEFLMEWTPVTLANLLLSHLGATARPAALLGSLAVIMLLGGVAGMLNAWVRLQFRALGLVAAAVLMALIFFIWLPSSFLPGSLLLIALFLPSLWIVSRSSVQSSNRRAFLVRSGVILGGAAVLLSLFSLRPVLDALAARRLFAFRRARGLPIVGLADLVTSNDRFYRMDKVLQYPTIAAPAWSLKVDGDVRSPREIDYHTLLRFPAVSRYITMECVDNPVGGTLIGNALWTGVPLKDILREIGAYGDTLVFHAPDEYSESVPRSLAEEAGAIVAYGMNGVTLPGEHGYPVRIVLPGIYGFKSVKWLSGITVSATKQAGSWRAQGWTEEGRIHTTTRIDVVRRDGARVLIAGVAFAGTRGIHAVQVQANDGPWLEATLVPALSHDSWVQWAVWLRGAGALMVTARAVDGTGRIQEARPHGSYPDGATGWPRARV
jgi:DMSO/TMAO reductase YedYZ molybdopterin-dependent catalytic subunit